MPNLREPTLSVVAPDSFAPLNGNFKATIYSDRAFGGHPHETCTLVAAYKNGNEQVALSDVILHGDLRGTVKLWGDGGSTFEFNLKLGVRRLVDDAEITRAERNRVSGIYVPVTLRFHHRAEEVVADGVALDHQQILDHEVKLLYPIYNVTRQN
jgi:hypothetical protein